MIELSEIRHLQMFSGMGGLALGFQRGNARVGNLEAGMRCIGAIDVDPAACRDFKRRIGVTPSCLDLFNREQYSAFHGHEPPSGWREQTPDDIRNASGYEFPNIVALSAPCKGFSGLLSESRSKGPKYQALNGLTLRGMWLMCEAYADDPPELIVFENVPRIVTRGRELLEQISALLRSYGYAVAPPDERSFHDCGELGGLAQSRKRFLLVARHVDKVPPFLYEPPRRPLRAVGEILGKMPLPGDPAGGPMHAIPRLQWKTWVRLAFVEAGSDWRSLNKLRVKDGKLAEYLIVPDTLWEGGGRLGVTSWDEPSGTIAGCSRPENGKFSVADPRQEAFERGYGVTQWSAPARTVQGQSLPSNGEFSVADPRFDGSDYHTYGVRKWEQTAETVTGKAAAGAGSFSVADPRPSGKEWHHNIFRIVRWNEHRGTITSGDGPSNVNKWDEPTRAVIGASTAGDGAFAVADPRCGLDRGKGDNYLTGGQYGVVPWDSPSGVISGSAGHDSGRFSVADPRMPAAQEKLICVIRALDNTWHRPFTTLELAALQSLVDPGEMFNLDGSSDSAKRERIGNAVPPAAAEVIASVMAETILLARTGTTFHLSAQPVWVRPLNIALSVKLPEFPS